VVAATVLIGLFYAMTIFLGFGAAKFVGHDAIGKASKAGNMAAPLLARALGGEPLFAFVCAVAFATIIAVVAGLVLTSASAFAHDIYSQIVRRGAATEREQLTAARGAAVGVALLSILIALGAEKQNVAFLVALAFTVAASANTPVILLTIFWRRFTTTGAIAGMLTGLISCLVLISLSPSVWNPEAGKALFTGKALFSLANPGIVSIPLGLLAAVVGSLLTPRQVDSAGFDRILVTANTGLRRAAPATEAEMLAR
jgi:cation/acetate symporter